MPVFLQTVCGSCPPCGVVGTACAIDRRQASVDADGFSYFASPNIVATVDADPSGGGATVPGGLPALQAGDWVRVDYRSASGDLAFFKYYAARIALSAGLAYVGGLGFWRTGAVVVSAGQRVRRRDILGAITYFTADEEIEAGLHDDPAGDPRWLAAPAGAYVAEYWANVWLADIWGISASVQRPLAEVQPPGSRPWITGTESRSHYRTTTPWFVALRQACASPRVYTTTVPKYRTWRDTTTITLETGEIIERRRTWTIDPVTQTVSMTQTGQGSLVPLPPVPDLPQSVVGIEHTDGSINVESWSYPEIPARGVVDGAIEHYWQDQGEDAFACGAFASGLTVRDWRTMASPDGASNHALLDHAVSAEREETVWEATVPWFWYDVDPKPQSGVCAENDAPGRYLYQMRCQVRQVVELLDPLAAEDVIPMAVPLLDSQAWLDSGLTSLTFGLAEQAQVVSGWVDDLPCLRVIVGGVRLRHQAASRYYLIGQCGAVGTCVGVSGSATVREDFLPSPAGWTVALVECGKTCLP